MRAVIVLCFIVMAYINPVESMLRKFGIPIGPKKKEKINYDRYPKLGACRYYYEKGKRMENLPAGLVEMAVWEYNGHPYVIGYLARPGKINDRTTLKALVYPDKIPVGRRMKVLIQGNMAFQYFGLPKDITKEPHGFFDLPWDPPKLTRVFYVDPTKKVHPYIDRAAGSSSSAGSHGTHHHGSSSGAGSHSPYHHGSSSGAGSHSPYHHGSSSGAGSNSPYHPGSSSGAGSQSPQPPMGRLFSLAHEPTPDSLPGSRNDPKIKTVNQWSNHESYKKKPPGKE